MVNLEYPKGLRVVNLGLGMATALTAKFLGELGAAVHRVAPPQGDPFDDIHPANRLWRIGSTPADPAELDTLLATADLCIVGGEDYPDLQWRFDPAVLAAKHNRLVVLSVGGYAAGRQPGPAVDILVQSRSGMAFEMFSAHPVAYACPLPTYGAVMHGLIGACAALFEREHSGLGQVVSTSLEQGFAMSFAPDWLSVEHPDAELSVGVPRDNPSPIVKCADGGYVFFLALAGSIEQVKKIYAVLGIDRPVDAGWRDKGYFGDIELYQQYAIKHSTRDLLDGFWREKIAAEEVLPPGACWDQPQVRANGIVSARPDGGRHIGTPISIRGTPAQPGPAERQPRPPSTLPLRGVRALDFGNLVGGPYSSKILADLGADVIKVEPPDGDLMRHTSARHFLSVNQGKRSIVVDIKTAEGKKIVDSLCASSNAVSHNFRVGVAERIGLDAESLRKLRGDLVTVHASAYGSGGPKALNSGLDPLMQVYCGHSVRAGGDGNAPLWYRQTFTDYATGALGALGILLGLLEQARFGRGAAAEVNLLDTGLYMMSELYQDAAGRFIGASCLNRDRTGFHPAECFYQTADGWIAVAARSDAMAERLLGLAGLSGRFGPRSGWGEMERKALAQWFGSTGTDELLARLSAADVWAERSVNNGWTQLLGSPDARRTGLVVEFQDHRYGNVKTVAPLFRFSRSTLRTDADRAAPALGHHTEQIMRELGYGEVECRRLRSQGVLR